MISGTHHTPLKINTVQVCAPSWISPKLSRNSPGSCTTLRLIWALVPMLPWITPGHWLPCSPQSHTSASSQAPLKLPWILCSFKNYLDINSHIPWNLNLTQVPMNPIWEQGSNTLMKLTYSVPMLPWISPGQWVQSSLETPLDSGFKAPLKLIWILVPIPPWISLGHWFLRSLESHLRTGSKAPLNTGSKGPLNLT